MSKRTPRSVSSTMLDSELCVAWLGGKRKKTPHRDIACRFSRTGTLIGHWHLGTAAYQCLPMVGAVTKVTIGRTQGSSGECCKRDSANPQGGSS
jgi:hypothetical protein